MQILHADPRDRRGSKERRAMISTLRGLGASDGSTLKKQIADAKAAVASAQAALDAATAKTSRDSYGVPSWTVGGPNILFTDLPDNFTSNDAANLEADKFRRALYGIVNSRDPRKYFAKENDASQPVEERFAGWVWSRLFSRSGWPESNLFGSIERTVLDEGKEQYFVNALKWWTSQVTSLPDSPELLVRRMVDPEGFRRLEEPENNIFTADKPGWTWGSLLGTIAGAAFVWVKRYAAAGREQAIEKAKNDLSTAQSVLAAAQTAAQQAGLTADGNPPQGSDSDCLPGYKLDKVTNRCVVDTGSPVLPWVVGGAAVLGLLLLLRRKSS